MSDTNGNLTPGDIITDQATGTKSVFLECPDGIPGCEVLHTRVITKPTLDEIRELNKKQRDEMTNGDWEKMLLADEDDLLTVLGESLILTVDSVSITANKK